jgi:hypothetical protein
LSLFPAHSVFSGYFFRHFGLRIALLYATGPHGLPLRATRSHVRYSIDVLHVSREVFAPRISGFAFPSTRVRGAFGDREDAHLVSRLFRGGPRRNLRKPTVGGAVFRRPRPLRPLFRFLRRKVVGVGDVGAKQ